MGINLSTSALEADNLKKYDSIANPNSRSRNLLDYFSTLEDIPHNPEILAPSNTEDESISQRIKMAILNSNSIFWLLLALLGVITALLAFLVDFSIDYLIDWREMFLRQKGFGGFCLGILQITFLCVVSTLTVHKLSSEAGGSGIPEVKTVLSGMTIPNLFSLRTLIAKVVGLVAAIGGGLSVGREGPFVHLASIISHQLSSNIRIFRRVAGSPSQQHKLLEVAVAVGLTATFGAPLGGVLFAIEVSGTVFMVSALWRAYFACFFTVLCFKTLNVYLGTHHEELFAATDIGGEVSVNFELILFAFLGICCGVLGGIFVTFLARVYSISKKLLTNWIHKYLYVLFVMVTSYVCSVFFPLLGNRDKSQIQVFFSSSQFPSELSVVLHSETWNCFVFILFKIVAIAASLATPVPAGSFVPTFLLGAAAGRFFGSVLNLLLPSGWVSNAAVYSVAGAAAFTGGVVRVLSITVIIFELTGEIKHMLPILAAVLLAYCTNSVLSVSLYDMLIRLKNLPYLPTISRQNLYTASIENLMFAVTALPVNDVHKKVSPPMTADSSISPKLPSAHELNSTVPPLTWLDVAIARWACLGPSVPLVESLNHAVLVGTVPCRLIDSVLQMRFGNLSRGGLYKSVVENKGDEELQSVIGKPESNIIDTSEDDEDFFFTLETSQASRVLTYTKNLVGQATDEAMNFFSREKNGVVPNTPPSSSRVHMERLEVGSQSTSTSFFMPSPPRQISSDHPKNSSSPSKIRLLRRILEFAEDVATKQESKHQFDFQLLQSTPFFLSEEELQIDRGTLSVVRETPVSRAHFLFTVLRLNQLFVTSNSGELLGVVTKDSFFESRAAVGALSPDDVKGFAGKHDETGHVLLGNVGNILKAVVIARVMQNVKGADLEARTRYWLEEGVFWCDSGNYTGHDCDVF